MTSLLELLYRAASSPFGIVVTTEDPQALRQALYRERKKDKDLLSLAFCTSPSSPDSEIWIVKKDASA